MKKVTKKATAKKATAKKAAAKTTKKTTKPTSKTKKVASKKSPTKKKTVRVRALEALRHKPLTATEVKEAIGLSHNLKPTLDQEVKRQNLRYSAHPEEKNIVTYEITKKGRSALTSGSVDPERSKK